MVVTSIRDNILKVDGYRKNHIDGSIYQIIQKYLLEEQNEII